MSTESRIISKLNTLIQSGISLESETFYIMGQIRKFLEHTFKNDRKIWEMEYPTLSLFNDWILHNHLNGTGARRKLDEYARYLIKSNNKRDPFELMKNITLFLDLKKDLEKFCLNYKLESDLLNSRNWRIFIRLLIEILKDFPLVGVGDCYINKFYIKNTTNNDVVTFVVNSSDGLHGEYQIDFEILADELH